MPQKIMKAFKNSFNLKIRLKNTFIVFGLLPIFLISIFLYFFVCLHQWNTVLSDANNKLNRAADAINIELSNAMYSSSAIVFNPYIISGITRNYSDTQEKVAFYNTLELYFANYKDPFDASQQQIIIYHNNSTLLNSKYTRHISELTDEDIRNKILAFNYDEVYWESNGANIAIYRKYENTGDYQGILKFSIALNKIKSIMENLNISAIDEEINYDFYPSMSNEKSEYAIYKELLNQTAFGAAISPSLKKQIYVRNFIIIFSVLSSFAMLLISTANFLSKSMSKKVYDFIQGIKNKKSLPEVKNIVIDDEDEFALIYKTIKDLITKIEGMHDEINKVQANKIALELEFIQSKINPHLLYNSLSAIKWKAMDYGSTDFVKNIDALTHYYRDSLSGGKDIVKISQELGLVEKYIQLMNFCHSHEYKYEIDVEDSVKDVMTIKHILQPIVENSILHGINRKKDGFIKIEGFKKGNNITITIADNGCGMNKEKLDEINSLAYKSQYKNYGIKNTLQRIKLYYGDECGFEIQSEQGKGTTVIINLISIDPDKIIQKFDFFGVVE